MIYLFLASALWALSYGFNKQELTGLNPFSVATIYCFVSFLFFLPFVKIKCLSYKQSINLLIIGAIEFGLMYAFFQYGFKILDAHEVAIWLLTTPVFLIIIDTIFKKQIALKSFILVIIVIIFSVLLLNSVSIVSISWKGVGLIQLCNLSFAYGQILFKRFCQQSKIEDIAGVMSLLYLGGIIICFFCFWISANTCVYRVLGLNELFLITIIGTVCCGLCHFLWNKGVSKVSTPVLAIMNNAQVPLAIIFSFSFFHEKIDCAKLLISLSLILIFVLSGYFFKKH